MGEEVERMPYLKKPRFQKLTMLLGCLLISACGWNSESGYLKIRIEKPGESFHVQFIPPDTQAFNVIVSGAGIPQKQPIETNLDLRSSEKVKILKVPIGLKTVSVVALGTQQKVLASGKSQLIIEGGKLNQVEVVLQKIETPFILPPQNEIEFVDNEQSAPKIQAFAPSEGKTGTIVYITGQKFALRTDNNQVFFNGARAEVLSRSDTALIVEVPPNVRAGPIEVITPNGKTTSKSSFQLLEERQEPVIEDFAPRTAPAGQAITLQGRNFDILNPEKNVVTFNNIQGQILSVDPTTLVVVVPPGNTSGFIKVTNRFGTGVSPGVFTSL